MRSTPYTLTGLFGSDATTVVLLRPDWAVLVRHAAAPHAWIAERGADGAALEAGSAALWCVALWVALGLLACLIGAIPGQAGRLGRTLATAVLPPLILRVLAGATGLGVILAPGLAQAGTAGSPLGAVTLVAHSASTPVPIPVPGWPTDNGVAAPTWPTTARPHSDPAARRSIVGHEVVVRPGDCLWQIAETNLPAPASASEVAAAWPRWYAANRSVIGADPAYLVAGEVLLAPASIQEEHR